MQYALTPSFKAALRHLQNTGQGIRATRGFRGRKSFGPGDGELNAKNQLCAIPHASDRHTIPCGTEVCPGDDILYLRHTRRRERGRRHITTMHHEYTVHVARVDALTPGFSELTDELTLVDDEDATTKLMVRDIRLTGIWRMPWENEWLRDGRLAEIMAQREQAIEDDAIYGHLPPAMAN